MFKYSVLFLLLVAFGAADEGSKKDLSSLEKNEILANLRVMLEVIRNECAKDSQVVKHFVTASGNVRMDVQPDIQKKFKDALNNSTKEGAADVLVPACEGLDQMKNVYVNITGYLVPCLEKNDMKMLQATYKMFDGVIKYTCDSHRSDIVDFIENGGSKCVKDKQTEIDACANSEMLNKSSEKRDENDRIFHIEKKHCDMFKNFKTCTTKTLKDCPYTAAASTIASLLDSILVEMPCYEAVPELENNI